MGRIGSRRRWCGRHRLWCLGGGGELAWKLTVWVSGHDEYDIGAQGLWERGYCIVLSETEKRKQRQNQNKEAR